MPFVLVNFKPEFERPGALEALIPELNLDIYNLDIRTF
jgi:hypothetical protein